MVTIALLPNVILALLIAAVGVLSRRAGAGRTDVLYVAASGIASLAALALSPRTDGSEIVALFSGIAAMAVYPAAVAFGTLGRINYRATASDTAFPAAA